MDKKGLNFLVGLGVILLIARLWWTGWLHQMGFLSINYLMDENLVYTGDGVYGTPLAVFGALLIDVIAIFGSLVIMVTSGLWDVLLWVGQNINDSLLLLREYIKNVTENKDKEPEKDIIETDPKDSEKLEPQKEKEAEKSVLELIVLELKAMQKKQDELQLELNKKVNVTEIVPNKVAEDLVNE